MLLPTYSLHAMPCVGSWSYVIIATRLALYSVKLPLVAVLRYTKHSILYVAACVVTGGPSICIVLYVEVLAYGYCMLSLELNTEHL